MRWRRDGDACRATSSTRRAGACSPTRGTLGLDLDLSDDLSPLFRPIDVGGRRVGNRLAIQPMEGCDGEPDGSPGELTFRRYQRFGAGGAKLIWGEAAAVVPEGRANPRQLVIDDATAAALERLLRETRQAHGEAGRSATTICSSACSSPTRADIRTRGRSSPSTTRCSTRGPIVDKSTGQAAGPETPLITDDELDRLQDRYVEAAALAFRIGFDFVDIKQCHRYLLNELLAARTRPGKYGGSFENRTRFIRELVGRIRAENPGGIVATRLNVFDGVPYQKGPDGLGVPGPFTRCRSTRSGGPIAMRSVASRTCPSRLALIGWLRDLGVWLVNVSIGNPYASPHLLRPFEYPPPDGYETPEHPLIGVDRHFRVAEAIQAAYPDIAVVGSGYSWLQAFAFAGRRGECGRGPRDVRRDRPRRPVAAGLRPSPRQRRAARPQADLPDLQLLHGARCDRSTTRWASSPPAARRSTRKSTARSGTRPGATPGRRPTRMPIADAPCFRRSGRG